MKSIYTLVGVAVLGAILGVSVVPATAADEFDSSDFYEVLDNSLYDDIDRA